MSDVPPCTKVNEEKETPYTPPQENQGPHKEKVNETTNMGDAPQEDHKEMR